MSSLKSIFPGAKLDKSKGYPFHATFEAEAVDGYYTFDNLEVVAHDAGPNELFYIESLELAGNIPDYDFNNALDPNFNDGRFSFQIIPELSGSSVTDKKMNFSQFKDNWALNVWYKAQRSQNRAVENGVKKENIIFRLNGQLIQTPSLTALGKDSIILTLSGFAYRLRDNSWISSEVSS